MRILQAYRANGGRGFEKGSLFFSFVSLVSVSLLYEGNDAKGG